MALCVTPRVKECCRRTGELPDGGTSTMDEATPNRTFLPTTHEPILYPAVRRARVLLLDDDISIAKFVRGSLSQNRFQVDWAPNVETAFDLIRTNRPDVALVDIRLPQSSGWEFVDRFRATERSTRLPIIMLTGANELTERERSFQVGADRYLVKPIPLQTLQRTIQEVLSAGEGRWCDLRTDVSPTHLAQLLFDPTTAVASLALVFDDLRQVIEKGEMLYVFCVRLEPLFRLGERNRWEAFDHLRAEFVRGLQVIVSGELGPEVVIATSHPGSNDFYCFVRPDPPSTASVVLQSLEREAKKMLRRVDTDAIRSEEVTVVVGGSITEVHPYPPHKILYNAVREAKDSASRRESRYLHGLGESLLTAIRERTLITHFQPIIDLKTRRPIGFEALTRGPAGSDIESPDVMFALARDLQLIWQLEATCIENLQPLLAELCSVGQLFLNLEAHFIQELHHRGTDILAPLLSCGKKVVIEVTERSAIRDYQTFRKTLHQLKSMGFLIAIDDCGSGYATLEAVAELHPDYLKVGHGLFHNVESDPVRRRLVELVARCADTIDAITIAEAIETPEQLSLCRELNIQLGQGFILARPAPWDMVKGY